MDNDDLLKTALNYITSHNEYPNFKEKYTVNQFTTYQHLVDLFLAFKKHLTDLGKLDGPLELTFKIFDEQAIKYQIQSTQSPLYIIDKSRRLNDKWIPDFEKDLNQCLTGEKFSKEIKPKRYKTITENIVLIGVDAQKLYNVYHNYSEYNHPYVNYQVSSILYNAKNFSDGLPILYEGIKSIASFPNFYWNNIYGVEGATWMLCDLLFLSGNGFYKLQLETERLKLLKLIYLYMSRYIYMTNSNLKSIDFYANRARIVKENYAAFMTIFDIGVNPDIQFISDMYLAYKVSMEYQLTAIPCFMDLMWESVKMYEHGSHIPNGSGGYKDIEDRSWMELVSIGEIRSIELANRLRQEFESCSLNISNTTINKVFNYLRENKKDDLENFLNEIKEQKLN